MSSQLAIAARRGRRWREDSIFFVRDQFGVTNLDGWEEDTMLAWNDPNKKRIAMKASKGPGKTTKLAWMAWQFLASRPYPKMAGTSISSDNLDDNLWPEMAKWQAKSKFLSAAFVWTKTRIFARQHPENWFFSARTWPRQADPQRQADTLAGLHADYVAFMLDEVGGVPRAVLATAEAGLATGIESRIVIAGNPTDVDGPLYDACTTERHLWELIEVNGDPDNPKRSSRVSVTWAREQIEKYGRDNPWVLVNVFGKFPPASLKGLLGPDQVSESMHRPPKAGLFEHYPRILGVDPGRMGGARSVIFPRQGPVAFLPVVMRPDRSERNWTQTVSGRIAKAFDKWDADIIFVDDTGGWGSGIIDDLHMGGYPVVAVNFAGKAIDPRYKNRRAEMYFEAAEWVKDGGCLPQVPELQREGTVSQYVLNKGIFQIEEKEQVIEKLNGESPDLWDAFVLTFAQPVAPRAPGQVGAGQRVGHAKTEDDDLEASRELAGVGRAMIDD